MNIDHRCLKKYTIVLIGMIYSILCVSRAALIPITMDESTTYLLYARGPVLDPGSIFHVYLHSKGNNHLLNSFLIMIIEMIADKPYQEILIRMPSCIFGVAFSAVCGILYCKDRIGTPAYLMLMGNNYLLEYFALARGYGMAAFLVIPALIHYREYFNSDSEDKRYREFVITNVFLLLAQSANTIVLLISFSMFVYLAVTVVAKKETFVFFKGKRKMVTFFLGCGHVLFGLYHVLINLTDLLYAEHNDPLSSIFIGYAKQYISNIYISYAAAIVSVILLIMLIIKKHGKISGYPVIILLLIHLPVSIVLGFVTGKGYPTGRVLLPAVPLLAFSAEELVKGIRKVYNIKKVWPGRIAVIVLSCVLINSYKTDLPPSATRDWGYTAGDRDYIYSVLYKKEKLDFNRVFPHEIGLRYLFYSEKIEYYNGYNVWDGVITDSRKYNPE